MSDRKVQIKRIPTTKGPEHVIDVYVSYHKGGVNFATYKNEPRGFYLHVQPIEVGENFVRFMGFSGYKQHIKDAARFSQKQLAAAAEEAKNADILQTMIDAVCEKNGLTLAEPATAA